MQMVDASIGGLSDFPANLHLHSYLVGASSVLKRPRVVPLRAAGAFGRPTPLGKFIF